MKARLKADQPHAVIDLVAAGAGFSLVPSSVQGCEKKRIVCRRLDPAPPELELSLAWVRGMESPAINSLLEVARQVVGQSRFHVSGESGADSHPGARVSLLHTPSTAATRRQEVDWDDSGEGRQSNAGILNENDRC